MRPNQQNKNRSRGRNGGRKHTNPLSRNFESNGPDVKIRGNASHIAEKYVQLARDAQASGDSVMAENYLQHAEHYFRIISAAQPQQQQRQDQQNQDDGDSDGDGSENEDAVASKKPSRDERSEDAKSDDAKSDEAGVDASADGETKSESGSEDEPAEKPKRERRPRRRKVAETAEAAGGEQPSVGELPAFLTGTTAAE